MILRELFLKYKIASQRVDLSHLDWKYSLQRIQTLASLFNDHLLVEEIKFYISSTYNQQLELLPSIGTVKEESG